MYAGRFTAALMPSSNAMLHRRAKRGEQRGSCCGPQDTKGPKMYINCMAPVAHVPKYLLAALILSSAKLL